MKLFFKIFLIITALGVIFLAGFGLWGAHLESVFSQATCTNWFSEIKPYAWSLGIALLIADLILPVPATGIMAALGSVYGLLIGTLIGVAGSAGAGMAGYALARFAGKKAIRRIASDTEIERFRFLFDRWGGSAIILSRIMPILPEVMTILAGLARMNIRRFVAALLFGTVPTCFLFAYLGHTAKNEPGYGVILAILLPLVIWPLFLKFVSLKQHPQPVAEQ